MATKPSVFDAFHHFKFSTIKHIPNPPFLTTTMFRAMSTRKGRRGYDQLISEPTVHDQFPVPKMSRSTTLPPYFFGDLPVKFVAEPKVPVKVDFVEKQAKKVSKVHPLFSIFERKSRKKKATAKPEFSRYMQYLKEGGTWDPNSSRPVIY
ncbi:hypothetical protein L2E82_33916 [Cichorium intybus]|uniref:Uncharacterized protein n=1 Tax=Cichorium intybus TaxID=13427 RepID=A0ACB9BLB9_CICIN|nr:hypothetical protein L2E82_33916 [Cichorium intybus]